LHSSRRTGFPQIEHETAVRGSTTGLALRLTDAGEWIESQEITMGIQHSPKKFMALTVKRVRAKIVSMPGSGSKLLEALGTCGPPLPAPESSRVGPSCIRNVPGELPNKTECFAAEPSGAGGKTSKFALDVVREPSE